MDDSNNMRNASVRSIGLTVFAFLTFLIPSNHAETLLGAELVPGMIEESSQPVMVVENDHWLSLDTRFSDALLDFQNRQTDKELFILYRQSYQRGERPSVVVGGQGRFSFLAAHTNRTDKFSYLGRFPSDFQGDTATDARLLQANAHATAHVTRYASIYSELLFSDVFTFNDFKQGSLQVRQAYLVIGNLQETPWYLYLGKKNVGFGDFQTLSPFTQSVVWHYFAPLAEGVGVGYHSNHWDLTLAAINGGRGIRVNDSTERGKLNNLAANATWRPEFSPQHRVRVGAGFLLGTIYDGQVAEHLDANLFGTEYNSAVSLFGHYDFNQVTLSGEFVTTTRNWPVTNAPIRAYRTEAAYWFDRSPYGSFVSASWSSGTQGPSGSEFEFNNQLVIGYGKGLGPNFRVSAEYVLNTGFAPLINITTVGDRSAVQNSVVLGMTLVF